MKLCTNILSAFATSLVAFAIAPASVHAAPVALVNPSFEDNIISDGVHTTGITGWNIVSGNTSVPIVGTPLTDAVTTYNPTSANYAGAAGNNSAPGMTGSNVLDLTGGLVGLTGVVTQTVNSVPIALGNTYTLTVSVGDPANFANHGYNLALGAGLTGVQGLTVLSSVSGTGIPGGTFEDISVTYTPSALDPLIGSLVGTPLTIQLSSSALLSVGASSVDFDNVRLDVSTSPVPEPSTVQAMIAGFALLGCIGMIRRRKVQA